MDDLARTLRHVAEARELSDPEERAVRLHELGRCLLVRGEGTCGDFECHEDGCDYCRASAEAIDVLTEAMRLGSPHAAFDLGGVVIGNAGSPEELAAGIALVRQAADAGLTEAQSLLAKVTRVNVRGYE
jgi:hypothetical protein